MKYAMILLRYIAFKLKFLKPLSDDQVFFEKHNKMNNKIKCKEISTL